MLLQPNILISKEGHAIIADFGLSEIVRDGSEPSHSTEFYAAGSRRWLAPELVRAETKQQGRRTTASDIYAFGIMMIEVSSMRK